MSAEDRKQQDASTDTRPAQQSHPASGAVGAAAGAAVGAAAGTLGGPAGMAAGAVAGGVLGGSAGSAAGQSAEEADRQPATERNPVPPKPIDPARESAGTEPGQH